jgi:hypothetical protein
MKTFSVLCVALCVSLPATAAFARGGMDHVMRSSVAAPSAPCSCTWQQLVRHSAFVILRPTNGPPLGTNRAIDRDEAKADKVIGSIRPEC